MSTTGGQKQLLFNVVSVLVLADSDDLSIIRSVVSLGRLLQTADVRFWPKADLNFPQN